MSSGAACSSGKVAHSHVLKAMGVDDELAKGAIRVSLGLENTEEDIDRFVQSWSRAAARAGEKLVSLSKKASAGAFAKVES